MPGSEGPRASLLEACVPPTRRDPEPGQHAPGLRDGELTARRQAVKTGVGNSPEQPRLDDATGVEHRGRRWGRGAASHRWFARRSSPSLCPQTPAAMESVLGVGGRDLVSPCALPWASSLAGRLGTLGGTPWLPPLPCPSRFAVSAETPLFKGERISFCSLGLDQRQSLG